MSLIYDLLWRSGGRFAVFGPSHLAALGGFGALTLLLIWLGRSAAAPPIQAGVRVGLGVCIMLFETLYVLYPLPLGTFDARYSLPLQVCDITAYATAVALITGWPTPREISCYLGLTTTLIACLTPDIAFDFPHIEFICFFISHALVVGAVLYMLLGLGLWPRPGAARRTFLYTNAYGAAIGLVNLALGANYVYLCFKPQVGSPLDWLGPWPYYVVVMDVIFIGVLALVAAALGRLQRRSGRAAADTRRR